MLEDSKFSLQMWNDNNVLVSKKELFNVDWCRFKHIKIVYENSIVNNFLK